MTVFFNNGFISALGVLITRLQQEKDGYFMPVVLFCDSDSELNRADTIILCGFRFNVYIYNYLCGFRFFWDTLYNKM